MKNLLKSYGIPFVEEMVVQNEQDTGAAAQKLGFPVALKALGPAHKTERSLVHLNLTNPEAVQQAAVAVRQAAGADLEGFLIQPQIKGTREFVAGMFRDQLFGPVIVFGLGGIFTEVLADVSLRLAPLSQYDAEEMIMEIKAKALLKAFRGLAPVDLNALQQILLGLSRLALAEPNISEVDLNPLMITPTGQPCVVDTLIVKRSKNLLKRFKPAVDPIALRKCFHPRSLVFIGATNQFGKWGHVLLTNVISGGFQGQIHLVNPKGGKIAGHQVCQTMAELPADIDLAVVTIPAAGVLDLIPQLQNKGIRRMLLISSGFAETGLKGQKLEKELEQKAHAAGIILLGPNTMGICNPHINLFCLGVRVEPRPGSTSIVSQSGNMGVQLLAFAEQQGIGIRGFSGSGNEAMVTIEDYLEGFEKDEQTKIVLLYIESVKNGRRFFETARRIGKKKPIVLLKGGQSGAGLRAAASHTGALAGDKRVFDAVCRQTGLVKVEQPMELLDLSAAFSALPLPKGKRTAIMTLGGGWGVVTSDLCMAHGLEVPELPASLIERLDKILPFYWSRTNPVDIVGESNPEIAITALEELLQWQGCDAVINLGIIGRKIMLERMIRSVQQTDPDYSSEFLETVLQKANQFEKNYLELIVKLMEKYDKPVYGVSLISDDQTLFRLKGKKLKGIIYETPERAVKSLARMYEYQCFVSNE